MINTKELRILHIMHLQKFLPPYIKFVSENFNQDNHKFVFVKTPEKKDAYGWKNEYPVEWIKTKLDFFSLIKSMYKADKIILHSLWLREIVAILCLQPWLLKKCYWVMWGGDFYGRRTRYNPFKRFVIKNMGYYLTYIQGDYNYIKKYFKAKGTYQECFMYDSNLYHDLGIENKNKILNTINIQIGNSAAARNNHIEILEKLAKYKDHNIKIYAPLGYGSKKNAQLVIDKGNEIFGDKFIAITDFVPFNKYLEYMSSIDIAIFAHKTQQAMGTVISLLGLGVKVYMRSDITPWELFNNINVKVFDVENIDLELLSISDKEENRKKIKEHFSEENYLKQLKNLFGND